jgi:hypothetical protein
MRLTALKSAGFGAALVAGGLGLWMGISPSDAADHAEAPGTQLDVAADIADYYAWHTADTTVHILTFGTTLNDGAEPTYDPDVLYEIKMAFPDETGTFVDLDADITAGFRYGQNGAGDWGLQVSLATPAGDIVFEGPVGEAFDDGIGAGVTVWTGLADDPFFFDAAGYGATLATGDLSFTGADAIAGQNVTAIVIEAPQFSPLLQTWATTARDNG